MLREANVHIMGKMNRSYIPLVVSKLLVETAAYLMLLFKNIHHPSFLKRMVQEVEFGVLSKYERTVAQI